MTVTRIPPSRNKGRGVRKNKPNKTTKARTTGASTSRISQANNIVTIRGRELISSVTCPIASAFTPVTEFYTKPINPGSNLFPWLSSIAPCFEKYRFNKLKFEIVCSNPTTIPGRYYCSVDSDVSDPAPATSYEMMASPFSTSGCVFQNGALTVDTARLNAGIPWRYTFPRAQVEYEPRTMHCGRFFFAAQGITTASTFDIYVDYAVDFITPQLADDAIQLSQQPATACPTTATQYIAPFAMNNTDNMQWLRVGLATPSFTGSPVTITNASSMQALDIRNMTAGSLSFEAVLQEAATAATAWMDTAVNMALQVYSNSGAYLGAVTSALTTIQGTLTDSDPTVAGTYYLTNHIADMDAVYAVSNAAAYLVPVVYTKATKAAAISGWYASLSP